MLTGVQFRLNLCYDSVMTELQLSSQAAAPTTEALARIGTALADSTRQSILLRLLDGPAYPADLADVLDTTRANISNHLSCLRGCGLVVAERDGRRIRYELADPELAAALRHLTHVVLAIDPGHRPVVDLS